MLKSVFTLLLLPNLTLPISDNPLYNPIYRQKVTLNAGGLANALLLTTVEQESSLHYQSHLPESFSER